MSEMIKVQLGEFREIGYYEIGEIIYQRGDYVILEADRGYDFGRVVSRNKITLREKEVLGKVVRVATPGDLKQIENSRMKARDAINTCMRKLTERNLDMRLVKAEYTFDSSKVIFYFTSEGRVDFRELVKDLARIFRVRIELKQIGVRDKAKIVRGHGICGRSLCCGCYMHAFHPLSIKMAKNQGLPLNPSRISGVCGRIKCCMAYEAEVYKEMIKGVPKLGEKLTIIEGKGRVIDINILKRMATIELEDGKIIKKVYPKVEGAVDTDDEEDDNISEEDILKNEE